MAETLQWIDPHERCPEDYCKVITVLFCSHDGEEIQGDICLNSIQHRNITEANGNIINVRQWNKHNERVTHWLDVDIQAPQIRKDTK